MGLRTPCAELIVGTDEEGVDVGLSREDNIGAAAKENSTLTLCRDGADDLALLNVELVVCGHAVERRCADRTETSFWHRVGTVDDLLDLVAGTKALRSHGDDRLVIALDAHLLREET